MTGDPILFCELARLGRKLTALHQLESPKLGAFITSYFGPKNPEVGRVGVADDTVWLDAAATNKGQPAKPGTIGFTGVAEEVWSFHIGDYKVCEKWPKDRGPNKGKPGRTLTAEDIGYYQKIVVAFDETIRLMGKIDEVIEHPGSWPAAFETREQG